MTDRDSRAVAASTVKTVSMLAVLTAALPVNLAVTGVALLRSLVVRSSIDQAAETKTILISGGKMTKALQLARSFHRAGHRVILVESAKYRFTGHRFSRAVDQFYVVPSPESPDYERALIDIVWREAVDVYVPVCSPAASYYDALAKPALSQYCEVIHCDPEVIGRLDDKYEFSKTAGELGLPVPDTHRITQPSQVGQFDFADSERPYILKSIPYDPVHRLELTRLPLATPAQTAAFARTRPMAENTPWIMQEFVSGQEYCTHSTVRNGQVQLHCCCESSPFQINYEMVDKPEIEAWVRKFVGALNITGQVSFDFIETPAGDLYAIECNPRTHSAITMFYNHPGVAAAYLDEDVLTVQPLPTSRPTYWIYHELWRLLTQPDRQRRLGAISRGKDAIFDWSDPLPFLLVHHLQIPWLLLRNLVRGRPWLRIDFNIGKLVEPAGD